MMTRSSASIDTPEAEQLAHWKAMSDAAQAHKFFNDNPKTIDKLAASIQGAYALTAGERKERDDAVQAVVDAKAGLKDAQNAKNEAIADAVTVKKEADDYSKRVRTEADNYKKSALDAIAVEQQRMVDDSEELTERQEKMDGELKQLATDKETVKSGMKEIADWRIEKESWEQDYTERSAKLDAKLRKAVKG